LTADELLARHDAGIVDLAGQLRALLRSVMPDAEERVHAGWHALGYRHPDAGYVCGIFPFDAHVRLLFEHGVRLPDPDGLLEGAPLRQVRYVTLLPGAPLDETRLSALVTSAIHLGVMRRAATPKPRR
jgi:hypothetical protein